MEYTYLFAQTPVTSNHLRAKYTILLFRIVMVIILLAIVLNFSVLKVFTENYQVPSIALLIVSVAQLAFAVPYILLAVFFLLWMNRAYQNLHQAQVEDLSYSKGWAIGVWFIPVVNLFLPDKIIKEIWDKTQEAFRNGQPFEKKKNTLVSFWWFAYIFSGILKVVAYFLFSEREFEMAYVVAISSNVISLFAALYGAKMIRNISVMEQEMMDRAAMIYQAEVSASAQHYLEKTNPVYAENTTSVAGEMISLSPFAKKESPQTEYTLVDDFTDNSERAKFLIIGLKLLILGAFLFGGICAYIATETKSGDPYEIFKAASHWLDKIIWGGLLVFSVTLIILMLWMKRAYNNLHNLDIKELSFGADAAVYSWFIPGANLFIPYIILQDINRHFQQAVNREKFPADKHPTNHTVIIIFWLLLLLSGILLYKCLIGMSEQIYMPFYGLPNVSYYAWFGIFSAIAGGFAFYLGIIMVNNISALEAQLFARLEEEHREEEIIEYPKEEESINPAGMDQNQIPPGNNFN